MTVAIPRSIAIDGDEWHLFCVDLAAGDWPPTVYLHARDLDHALWILGDLPIITKGLRRMAGDSYHPPAV